MHIATSLLTFCCEHTHTRTPAGLAERTHSHRDLGQPRCAGCLTDAQMGVDGGIAGSAGEVLILAVGDVLVRPGVTVLLSQAKVDDVDQVAFLAKPHKEVVGLHVSVDEVLGVDVFNPADLKYRHDSRV